jgi:phage regulator Rha-like protein
VNKKATAALQHSRDVSQRYYTACGITLIENKRTFCLLFFIHSFALPKNDKKINTYNDKKNAKSLLFISLASRQPGDFCPGKFAGN